MKIDLKRRLLAIAIMAALAASLAGCKDDGPSSKVFVKDGKDRPMRVAVIDFANLAPRSDEAGRVVTNAIITYMLSTGAFDVVEPGVVDKTMEEQRIRPTVSGMDAKSCSLLRDSLNVDAILTGTVEEYGDVRIGNETYPAVSFSARLVNARDASIVWAGMVSRTGADKVLLFDIRRISSMGKLVKSAVEGMAASMLHDQSRIVAALRPAGSNVAAQPSAPEHGTALPVAGPATAPAPGITTVSETPAAPAVTPAVAVTAASGGKSTDEAKTYTSDELKALLIDVAGFTKKDVEHSKHYHDTVKATYQIGDGPQYVEVKLVDYLKLAQTQKFMQTAHEGETVGEFAGLPAFLSDSQFSIAHIDIAIGRFGLYIEGPVAKRDDVQKLATALVGAVK